MKPARFEYHRPTTVAAAVELLDEHAPAAELMAGNQSLGIMLSTRLATPEHVIDLNRVDDIAAISVNGDTKSATIGAMARHREIERSETLAEYCPMLPLAAGQIAGPAVRNRGTFGGSLGEADPAGNYPCVLTALSGVVHLTSTDGERDVPVEDFFRGYMFTDIREDELITGASIPLGPFPPDRTGMAFQELKRAAQTWPTISAGAAVRVDDPTAESPTVTCARVALANAADVPLRIPAAETVIEGESLTAGALTDAADAVRNAVDPRDEVHADAGFKTDVAAEYAKRALQTAYERANDGNRSRRTI